MSILKKIFLWLSALFLILVATGLFLSYKYSDALSGYLIKELNKYLVSEVHTNNVHFSFLRRFPDASLEFSDVVIYKPGNDIQNYKDTLISAKKISLQFSMLSLLSKHYVLKNIYASEGLVDFKVDPQGRADYIFWKQDSTKTASDFAINLKNVELNAINFSFKNQAKQIHFFIGIDKAKINGNFSAASYGLNIETDLGVRIFSIEDINYIRNKKILLSSQLDVKGKTYQIRRGIITALKQRYYMDGNIHTGDISTIDLNINGNNLSIQQVIEILPNKIVKNISSFTGRGNMDFAAHINGNLSNTESPKLVAVFKTENATLIQKKTRKKIQNIQLNGSFSNGISKSSATSILMIDTISATIGTSTFASSGFIKNFEKPTINIKASSSINLKDLQGFFPKDNIEKASGKLDGNLHIYGNLKSLKEIKLENFSELNTLGTLDLQNIMFKLSSKPFTYSNINGTVELSQNPFLHNVSVVIQQNDFLINGRFANGLRYLLHPKEKATIDAEISCNNLNVDNYFYENEKVNKKDESNDSLKINFPDRLNLNLKFNIKHFSFRKFSASDIKGIANYKPRMFVLRAVSFDAVGGRISGGGIIIQKLNHDFIVRSQTSVNKIDIHDAFYAFNNFGQQTLRSDHLKGILSGEVNFSAEWHQDLSVIKKSIRAETDVEIHNGELINFEPMMGLSRFIDVSELQDIRFSTLKNQIFIQDQVITIPKMDISSSALDLTASGTHDFQNNFSYRIKLLLSDILTVKAKRRNSNQSEFGVVEEDGLGRTKLFLKIEGNIDDYKVTYDKKGMMEQLKQDLKTEKQNLKNALKNEFGRTNRDQQDTKNPEPSENFKIEWEGTDSVKKKNNAEDDRSNKKKPVFKVQWEDLPDTTRIK
ncbi:MAG TPA: AsmA-like C-terminal region-containing protein [Bacteroidales bacterium]|nr:AsmA-like C-terminal region-containing protein [Bacteroidales bacterium]